MFQRLFGRFVLLGLCLAGSLRPDFGLGHVAFGQAENGRPEPRDSDGRAGTPGVDWPRFLGPTGNSKSPETGILTEWGECGPPVVWHCELGTGYGIGSVAAGAFYQLDRVDDRARLRCLDRRTGKLLWQFAYPTDYEDLVGYDNGPRSSPVIDDGRVYIFGAGGMLHCLRADDGRLVWKVDTAKRFGVVQNYFGVGSTPVVEGDLLIVMVGGSPPECQDVGRFNLDRAVGNGTGAWVTWAKAEKQDVTLTAVPDNARAYDIFARPVHVAIKAGKATVEVGETPTVVQW